MDDLQTLLDQIRACRACEEDLDLGPRPVLRARPSARILIIGQAPGTRVHETGIPWNDPSGERLRDWLGVTREVFYDESRIAIVPMGFCYPGRDKSGGDRPPRPECAPLWHDKILAHLTSLELILLVGAYAQKRYLGRAAGRTMTETVRAGPRPFAPGGPELWPLPHPSWRNTAWLKKNPWFEAETLPRLRARVAELLARDARAE